MNTPTPVTKFGKDHWSLFAYVEDLCVNGRGGYGTIDRQRLRCNASRHPLLVAPAPHGISSDWKPTYGTKLSGFFDLPLPERLDALKSVDAGVLLPEHDDWDALEDLEAAGFLAVVTLVSGYVCMTGAGLVVAAKLRAHKAAGGQFADFVLK